MTTHALFHAPGPVNEPNLTYAPGTRERSELRACLDEFQSVRGNIPCIIGGKEVFLCWEKDEDDIEFWHDLETGYGGRERLS